MRVVKICDAAGESKRLIEIKLWGINFKRQDLKLI